MASPKRAYKLQEFVAHSSNVNCLKIGRKTSRVLVTGGEDHKVNIWSIGKPNSILSLSGHTSAVESVNFDSAEALVAAGAASGSIKLWDLEEARIVRTLTGHRSNCVSVDFHPFGEFFASGSLDTNLKIWDIRKKGCIHTYKGHTRGVNAIRFTPDGRWVVSGGQDNTVKLWDLTAGKLLHDFKCHEGQIQCIDFHPHEFLLATGSADRTVKFWDLETFELIGSAGPETSGVRAMAFNPDGRTLLCGLHESLKVLSWEPIRYHGVVDVGWSTLSDLNIHEGKLLGCSYNQGCVGVWVVDISRIEPYVVAGARNDNSESRSTPRVPTISLPVQTRDSLKASMGRLSISQNSELAIKEIKSIASTGSAPSTPQRPGSSNGSKAAAGIPAAAPAMKRSSSKSQGTTNRSAFNKSDVVPVIVPRASSRVDLASNSRKETGGAKTLPNNMQSKISELRKFSNIKDDTGVTNTTDESETTSNKSIEPREVTDSNFLSASNGVSQPGIVSDRSAGDVRDVGAAKLGISPSVEPNPSSSNHNYDIRVHKPRDASSSEVLKGGRTKSLVASWERREQSPLNGEPIPSSSPEAVSATTKSFTLRRSRSFAEKETVSASDEDAIADLMDQHEQFISSAQSRLTKLQVVRRVWERNDIKGVISAMEKMSDYAVSADILSVLMGKSDTITLDLCTRLLPLITRLLDSKVDRHLCIFLEMALKLVRTFGPVIRSTVSASRSSVGVDLQAEQRLERCNLCFIELEEIKNSLPALTRIGGSVSKSAMELNLALQEVL